MKFFNLFKKELREMITLEALAGMVLSLVIFLVLGQVMSGISKDMSTPPSKVIVADLDNTALTKQSIDALKANKMEIIKADTDDDLELIKLAKENGLSSAMVFPKGFEADIQNGKSTKIKLVTALTSFSMMGNNDRSASIASTTISNSLTDYLIQLKNPNANIDFIKAPVTVEETTVANGKSEIISSSVVSQFAMQQSMFIPIIIFILIVFASQMNAATIANEKTDKTLETLLSAPISRLSVLSAKMAASGIFSLAMAVVYMFGFSSYMGGMIGGGSDTNTAVSSITTSLERLGLSLTVGDYFLLGLQLFLTLVIALAISMVLGALAKDLKAAQSMIMPLMFCAMIPYFISMFLDINSLPAIARILVYLIPFTHTFAASANILFGNTLLYVGGAIYQVVFLIVILFIAVRIFSTDKIFTMTLGVRKKDKKKANSTNL